MSRPHICFVQAQHMPWRADYLGEIRPGVSVKVLSRDVDTGASTALVRYPSGYERSERELLTAHEEILVLDGGLEINHTSYGYHGYAFLPAGLLRTRMAAPNGAVVLTMFWSEPTADPAIGNVADYESSELIEDNEVFGRHWLGGLEGSVTGKPLSNGLATKLLRRDETTGEQSFLYSAHPHHPPPTIMVGGFGHPMVEEIFVLEGEFVFGDLGVMRQGAYCWWREDQYHGPVGSRAGYCMFIRNLNGLLQNEFLKEPRPFDYRPAHSPALPPELEAFSAPWSESEKW